MPACAEIKQIRRRRWWILSFSLVLLLGLIFVGLCILAGSLLARPPIRELHEYHEEILRDPGARSLVVQSGLAKGQAGAIPYLYCMPDVTRQPSARGKILRDQLTARGKVVPAFGYIRATLILLHGRTGRKEDLLPVAERYCAIGFRCLIPDLPAHGENEEPACAFGAGAYEAKLPGRVLEDAASRFGFSEDDPVILWGMSMGGSYAIHAAADDTRKYDALIIVCSFADLGDVTRRQVKRWAGPLTPVGFKVAARSCRMFGGQHPDSVKPAALMRKVKIPAMVLHGTDDPLIPFEQGRKLYEANASLSRAWLEVPGANHNNILVTPHEVFADTSVWMEKVLF